MADWETRTESELLSANVSLKEGRARTCDAGAGTSYRNLYGVVQIRAM